MSAVAGAATKKRKKPDSKPQAQLNKCLNEKRRREQENIFIEELAELISVTDMSSLSVKPDKCAILQETVTQIRRIKQQEGGSGDAAVQQGEVSSSNPTVLRNEVFGPLLLEALDGFLFVVNPDGKIEYVTENVNQFIKFTRDDVQGKSIYNIIHHGDHARFSSCLLPVSIGWPPEPNTQSNRRMFHCRLLVKPPDDQDETMEEKQQRVSKYENMQIQCTQVQLNRDKGDERDDVTSECNELGLSLMCVARRIPQNEKSVGTPVEQFTMKLDTSGKIIGIDTIGVSATYSQYLNKDLMGQIIQELCHQQDLQKLANHLKEALTTGQSTSAVYRLRVTSAPDKFIHVQTKSKLFKANSAMPHEPDFIMATHSIIGDNDLAPPDGVAGAASSPRSVASQQSTSSSNGSTAAVGGPLMSAPVAQRVTSTNFPSSELTYSNYSSLHPAAELSLPEFDLFPSSTWAEAAWSDSRASLTPVSTPTPRPPSPFANTFPFSPLQDHAEGKPEVEMNGGPEAESGRLRNLLTKRTSTSEESEQGDESEARQKHRILKGLLNQEEDEPMARDHPKTPNNNNNMLLKLLNEKSDDDDLENRAGLKKQHELLQQLLKEPEDERKPNLGSLDVSSEGPHGEDTLLKSLGFRNTSPSPPDGTETLTVSSLIGSRKRPSDDAEVGGGGGKRPHEAPSLSGVSSSGNSKLWEKNKMLASLLAKQPSKTVPIPPIPTSVISATPQDKLPKVKSQAPGVGGPWSQGAPGRPLGQQVRVAPRQPSSQFLSQILSQDHAQGMHGMLKQQVAGAQQAAQQAGNSSEHTGLWDTQSDPVLSDLLDQVIDIVPDVPDAVCTDSSTIMSLLDLEQTTQSNQVNCFQQEQMQMNERMAINAIQKSLMLCETAVKSPVSPTMNMGTPPCYNASTISSNQPAGFPPPPVYQVQPRVRFSMQAGPLQNRPNGPQYTVAPGSLTPQQQQQMLQRKLLADQQAKQQKQRLLQQQQQQQLVIPSNAVPGDQQLQSIDSLLNTTPAPNVSLQRSSSVNESQLSPSYGNQLNSAMSPGQRLAQQPYSPHGQLASPQQQYAQQQYAQQQARLSPSFQQSQLSPRMSQGQQAVYSTVSQVTSQSGQQTTVWSQQQQQAAQQRLSLQQQQNPMLNAQLASGGYGNGTGNAVGGNVAATGRFPVQRPPSLGQVRSLASPGTPTPTRQSPFPPEAAFPPPASPGAAYQSSTQQFPQMRMQRIVSQSPTAQLPGGRWPMTPMPPLMYHEAPPFPYDPSPNHPPSPLYERPARSQPGGGTGPGSNGNAAGLNNGGGGVSSEYVRQELRAIVGARTQQQASPRQQHSIQQVSAAELEALGLSFEMASGPSESPKLWGAIGSELGAGSPQPGLSSRSSMEEVQRAGDHKSSLLQKLLSE